MSLPLMKHRFLEESEHRQGKSGCPLRLELAEADDFSKDRHEAQVS